MLRRVGILLTLCLSLAFTATLSAAELRVVADSWPPYTDDALPNKGLATDIVMTALTRAGYAPRLRITSNWSRTLEGAMLGNFHVIAAAWYSDARAQHFSFSKPYMHNRIRLVKRAGDEFVFSGLPDLKGKTIGVVRNYAYGAEFDRANYLIKIPHNHPVQVLLNVLSGQVRLGIGDELVLRHQMNEFMSNEARNLEFVRPPLSVNGLHIAVSKQHPQHQKIAADFDKAVEAMKADGTYAKILESHKLQ